MEMAIGAFLSGCFLAPRHNSRRLEIFCLTLLKKYFNKIWGVCLTLDTFALNKKSRPNHDGS